MNPKSSGARSGSSTWVWIAVVMVIVVAGAAALALAAGGDDEGTPAKSSTEIAKRVTVSGAALPRFASPTNDAAIGKPAPELSGVSFDGTTVKVANDGKAHVVVFLAHWCPHCQAEVPRLVALAKAGGITVPVTAVATGTDASADNYPPSAWFKREQWPYPVLVDTADSTAAAAYGLSAYPFLVFVDAQGTVVRRFSGEILPDDLAKIFKAFAAGQTVPVP